MVNYANNQSRAESLKEDLLQLPCNFSVYDASLPRVLLERADVSQRSEVESLVANTIQVFGRLDVIVGNAGWTRFTNFWNLEEGMEDEDWEKCLVFNVKSHMWIVQAAREYLDKAEGAVVTVSSTAGVRPGGSSLVG